MTKKQKDANAPSFYRWQLMKCRELDISPDVIMAALDENTAYTMEDAKKAIKKFLTRKV